MKAKVLVDNLGDERIQGEWGLSIWIEYGTTKVLLDAGSTGLFATNADLMCLPLEDIHFGVLSHAHYDHADGMRTFFERNDHAPFYLQASCGENCYKRTDDEEKYIGIGRGILTEYKERIRSVKGDLQLEKGIWLLSHKTPGLEKAGRRENMYRRIRDRWIADDFSHEQSLVFLTENGLVIFNSCCHGGADTVIQETAEKFPEHRILALVGGFHLFNKEDAYIRSLAQRIRKTGIERICTGHCTRDNGYRILREELGESVQQLRVGMEMIF